MSVLDFDFSEIDPTLLHFGKVIGIVDGNDLNTDWFASPYENYLSTALTDRPDDFVALLGSLLQGSSAQVLGLPTASQNGEQWYSINHPETGQPSGLYLVVCTEGGKLRFGLGTRWIKTATGGDPLNMKLWAHLPVFETSDNGSGPRFLLTTDPENNTPIQFAVEVTHQDKFGTDEISFRGVKLGVELLLSQSPQVSFVFLDMNLPGEDQKDLYLNDLAQIEDNEWIRMALALLIAQVQTEDGNTTQLLREHILPILGIGGDVPAMSWEQLPDLKIDALRNWFIALINDQASIESWLDHWGEVLASGAGNTSLPRDGSGTRTDPYRVGVDFGGLSVVLYITFAYESQQDGTRIVYPGLWLAASEAQIAGATHLAFESTLELAAIALSDNLNSQPLPNFDARMRLYNHGNQPLIDGHPVAELGAFTLGELRTGISLNADQRPQPMFELLNVSCDRGSWPVLDLSSAGAVLDGVEGIVNTLIQDQLEALLGADEQDHPGRYLAALMGFAAPSTAVNWEDDIKLATDANHLSDFLGNPLAAIGCYHVRCLENQISGAPAWVFLLHDLAALLRDNSVPVPAITGNGTEATPWRVVLYDLADGEAALLAWTVTKNNRPQLHLDLELSVPTVQIDASTMLNIVQRMQILHANLPPSDNCPDSSAAAWLPGTQVFARLTSSDRLTLPSLAGLELSALAIALACRWRHQDGWSWWVTLEDPQAHYDGMDIQLGDLSFNLGLSWDLSLPDFGLNLPGIDLGDLFRVIFGLSLCLRGGPFGFSLAGLFGLLPDLPNISLPGLPDWSLGPFALPFDWPKFNPPNWPDFFLNPCPYLRLYLGNLFSNSKFAWPAIRWLGGAWNLSLPDLSLPSFGWPFGDGGGINFPSNPFEITGSGTYEDPWAITMFRDGEWRVQQLIWLDPDGPPSGDAVDIILALLPDALQNLNNLIGEETFTFENLATILDTLSTLDADLKDALKAVAPSNLAEALQNLENWLSDSDGAILSVRQQPVKPNDHPAGAPWGWNDPLPLVDLPQVHHWAQLGDAAILNGIEAKINQWSNGDDPAVLLLGAPWESASAWADLLSLFAAANVPHFDLNEFGTNPDQISLEAITQASRFYTADIAVFNTAPETSITERAIPVSAPDGHLSQASQVGRLIERIRALNPGRKVILVAHSSAGLAARALASAESDDSRVRGLITIGTSHIEQPADQQIDGQVHSALAWLNDDSVREVLGFINRLDPDLIPNDSVREVTKELLKWIQQPEGSDPANGLPIAPAHIFTPTPPIALPAGIDGHAIATRLPQVSLRDEFLNWLNGYLDQLRTALDNRQAPTHVGFGLRLLQPAVQTDDIRLQTRIRQDLTRIAFSIPAADSSAYVQIPRLTIHNAITRQNGWLVGDVGQNPRLRWAELGLAISQDGLEPIAELHDGHIDGAEFARAQIDTLDDGGYSFPSAGNRLLDEMMAALTRGTEALPAIDNLAALMDDMGLMVASENGYGFDPGGWDAMLADPAGYLGTEIRATLASASDRQLFYSHLETLFNIQGILDIPALLTTTPSESPEVSLLREVMAGLGLLHPQSLGYAPKIDAWIELLAQPATALHNAATTVLENESQRVALTNRIREVFNLDDVNQTQGSFLLHPSISLEADASGKIGLVISPDAENELTLGNALHLSGSIELDLNRGNFECTLKVHPTQINAAIAFTYQLAMPQEAGGAIDDAWKVKLCIGDEQLPFQVPDIELLPVPADLRDRLGELLPPLFISSFAASLLEEHLLNKIPQAGSLFDDLGLAYQRDTNGKWLLRPFNGLIESPVDWLLSAQAFGDECGKLSPSKLVPFINHLRDTLGLNGPNGGLQLPYGLQILATEGSNLELHTLTSTPINLASGLTLDSDLQFTITPELQVITGGNLDFTIDMPDIPGLADAWEQVNVHAGYNGDQFSLKFGGDGNLISILPFSGWDSALLDIAEGAAVKLLPKMVDATLTSLEDQGGALANLASQLTTAATALDIDSADKLPALAQNPVGWLQERLSASESASSASAIATLLASHINGLNNNGGLVVYDPHGGQVVIKAGRQSQIGLWITVVDLDVSELKLDLTASITIDDTITPTPQVGYSIDLAIPEALDIAGIDIGPRLHCDYNSGFRMQVYPLGLDAGTPDFQLSLFPTFQMTCVDNGSSTDLTDCLLSFARNVLAPLAVNILIDDEDVKDWLDTALVENIVETSPGSILDASQLLKKDGQNNYSLRPLNSLPDVQSAVLNLLSVALEAFNDAVGDEPIISLGEEEGNGDQSGIFLASLDKHLGLRLKIPSISISSDPEINLILGGDTEWIGKASDQDVDVDGGISLYLIHDVSPNGNPQYQLEPRLDIAGVGLDISGKNDQPLFDLSGFRMGGFQSLFYASLTGADGISVDGGLCFKLNEVGIPLGLGEGNPIAKSLLGGNGGDGDQENVNPSFNLTVAYVDKLYLDLAGAEEDEVWFPIQASFGPVHIDQIGVRWDGVEEKLSILVDGGVTIEGLAMGVDDLELIIPVRDFFNFGSWELDLAGLAVAYSGGGVRIAGGLLKDVTPDGISYTGMCLIEVAGRTFIALGSFMQAEYTSLFVFVVLPLVIGGPPYLFIIGLAGGFGYNRGMLVPDVSEIDDFILISLSQNTNLLNKPELALTQLGEAFPPLFASYWVAAGIRFTSFELVRSFAMVYLLLDRGLEIGLLGLAEMQLPRGLPLVVIEMALKARFSTREGLLSVEARLTDNSWLLYRDCRLTGGFAFYLWFGGPYRGQFLLTIGGYHPRFNVPAHFPQVPRLGFYWRVSSCITIKGEAYFALTSSCVMAGGLLDASYKDGGLKAWFKAWAHFLISWKPFHYDIEIGISIGVSYTFKVWLLFGSVKVTLKVEIGATVWIWGPELSGKVKVTWFVISFTFYFGAGADEDDPQKISWGDFRAGFLPADNDMFSSAVAKGLIEEERQDESQPWLLKPEFMLRTETTIPANQIEVGGAYWPFTEEEAARVTDGEATIHFEIDIRPTGESNITSKHTIDITGLSERATPNPCEKLEVLPLEDAVPAALWDNDDTDEKPDARTIPAWTGVLLVADIKEDELNVTDPIPVKKIFDMGIHPLPFADEVQLRISVEDLAAEANMLNNFPELLGADYPARAGMKILQSSHWNERRENTLHRLDQLGVSVPTQINLSASGATLRRHRSAPPQISSLYEGLAAQPKPEAELEPIEPPPVPPVVVLPLVPRLKAVLRTRPEPTRSNARNTRTTVSDLQGIAEIPRLSISRLTQRPITGAGLQRLSTPQENRPTAGAKSGQAFHFDRYTTRQQRQEFIHLQSQAIQYRSPDEQPAEGLADEKESGVSLGAGHILVWELPTRNTSGQTPTLVFTGDQGLRITCFDRGSALLADIETDGNGSFSLPHGTARFAVSGLGYISKDMPVEPGMGAVSLFQATHPVAAAGWLGSNPLAQVTRSAILARGAIIKMAGALRTRRSGRRVDQAFVKASEAARHQSGMETCLPKGVETIGLLIEHQGGISNQNLAQGLGLSVTGVQLSEKPLTVMGAGRAMLLYDVIERDDDAQFVSVRTAHTDEWQVEGVIGLRGTAGHWFEVLANEPLTSLIENGPLTPQGRTQLSILVDAPTPQKTMEAINDE